jgi:ATP-binding cassette, subfamily F, member 3
MTEELILRAEGLERSFGGIRAVAGVSLEIPRGCLYAVIGPNGSGKTTFVKTVLGKLPQLEGEVRWGTNVSAGYYAQQLDDLDERNEIIMELRRVAAPSATAGELRSFLAKFLFTGDDVYKHVRDLSGGEKGRLALAKLIYSRVNVLILDEPTNHLDIPSREALEEALDAYDGTIITISHDRYFLDRVATQILALDGRGTAEHYDGDYTEFHDWKAARRAAESRPQPAPAAAPPAPQKQAGQVAGADGGAKGQAGRGAKKKKSGGRDPRLIEGEIAEAEKRLAALAEEMSRPEAARDAARAARLGEEYRQADERLQALFEEWERASAEAASA